MELKTNSQIIEMLIKFYNMQAGTSFRTRNELNQSAVAEALGYFNNDVAVFKNFVRNWVRENEEESKKGSCFGAMVETLRSREKGEGEEKKTVEVEPEKKVTESEVQYSMGLLEKAVVELIAKMNAEKIESAIMGSVEDKVRAFIKDEYGTIERRITTIVDGKKSELKGVQHDKFETVLKFVSNDEPVYLAGPAGSGKNVLCKQVAEALGLDFYFTNAVTQEYQLKGFTDAMGNYQETSFYKAFKNGGLFFLDEMDASIPEVLVILNAAIANRYFDFPAPIGYVEANPNFRVIAAGNTTGHGADFEYVGRNQLDGASLNRFAFVKIEYSEAIENNVAEGDLELANFCRNFRKTALKSGIDVIVSYREIGRLAKMLKVLNVEEALDTCLVKDLSEDSVNIIVNSMSDNSKYHEALKKLAKRY